MSHQNDEGFISRDMEHALKPTMPIPAPTIEIFPGINAELMDDPSRFSNGKMVMTLSECKMGQTDDAGVWISVGSLITSADGLWYAQIGEALYRLPMKDIFIALFNRSFHGRKVMNHPHPDKAHVMRAVRRYLLSARLRDAQGHFRS